MTAAPVALASVRSATVPSGVRLLLAWSVLLAGLFGFWLLRPYQEPMDFYKGGFLVLFTTSKFATLLCMPGAEWRRLSWGRFAAYLLWPGMQPHLFLPDHTTDATVPVPTLRGFVLNLLTAVVLLWVLPLVLPAATPLFLRVWIGLTGYVFLYFFAVLDAWALLYRRCGIGVDKLWACPIVATSLQDFWGRRWNRVFSGMLREMLFQPLVRRTGVAVAVLAVYLYSGLLHENFSVTAGSGYGRPILYFLIQFVGVWLERTPLLRRLLRRHAVAGWLWTFAVVLGPVTLLLHPGFVDRIVIPSLQELRVPGLPG